jgi:branched-chain amino acid transport system substrate-binding protein
MTNRFWRGLFLFNRHAYTPLAGAKVACKMRRLIFHANLLLLIIANCLVGCKPIGPVKIGLIGTLMGRKADSGLQARDGALLAVEQCNRAGGVKGRPVELVIKNDQAKPQMARKAYRELVSAQVVTIISQMNSATTVKIWPELSRFKILMLSLMVGAGTPFGRDDYFFTLYGSDQRRAKCLAAAATQRNLKRAALVYDTANAPASTEWVANFKACFEQSGGRVVQLIPFVSGNAASLSKLAIRSLQAAPDLVLAITNTYDTAILFQKIRVLDPTVQLATTDWANTNGFLEYGGPAVDGVFLAEVFDEANCTRRYLKFKKDYGWRFGAEPTLAAKLGYETTQALLAVLSRTRAWDADSLKTTFLQQRTFPGLQGAFVIDGFGDAQRRCFLATVENGKFRRAGDEAE